MIAAIALLVLFFVAGAFFQASELAIVAVNRVRVRHLRRRGHPRAATLERIVRNPEAFLTAILVGTNISVIGASSVATYLAETWLPVWLEPVFLLVVTMTLLFFGEIVPKGIARRRPTFFLLKAARPLGAAYVALWPIARLAQLASRKLLEGLGAETTEVKTRLGEEELRALFSIGARTGVLADGAEDVARRLFELGRTPVRRVMTPRERVVSAPIDAGVEGVLRVAAGCGFTRIPITEAGGARYVGCVNVHSALLAEGKAAALERLVHPAPSVPAAERASRLLSRLQGTPHRMALVEGEGGEHVGIVTIEDLLEEVLGELP